MGMDVYGKRPKNDAGKYFRASVWSWRPLIAIMVKAGADVPKSWSFNDGQGLNSQAACNTLAAQIEEFMSTAADDDLSLPCPEGMGVDAAGHFGKGKLSPYSIERSQVAEFCKFLRNCGGFKIN